MKRSVALAALALVSLSLSACAEGPYRHGVGVGWVGYPYHVWYDGYYGPFYDGYWGTDGFFYFRLDSADNHYRRGIDRHFRRGEVRPAPNYRPYEGRTREPPRGTRMPNYPRRDGRGDRR